MGDMTYRAATGYPWDWGLENPHYKPAPMVIVQPRTSNEPLTILAINGESRTAVQLDKMMLAKLLSDIAKEAVKELERE